MLADWAACRQLSIRLLVKPGDHVFPGAPIALVKSLNDGADDVGEAIRSATGLGGERASSADLEYTIRQLVEVAVRALSAGINDPHTAISVLDRLGASLCDMVGRNLPSGVWLSDGKTCLLVPGADYGGVKDAMFPMIRQNAAGSTAVLTRMLDMLTRAVRSGVYGVTRAGRPVQASPPRLVAALYQPMALGSQVAIAGKKNTSTMPTICSPTKGSTPR